MRRNRTPWILHLWMVSTFCFAYPIAILCKYLHARMGADPLRFSERLGHNALDETQEVLWFHAASLGEVRQLGSLAAHLHKKTGAKVLVTTTTATGADWVAQETPFAIHRYAPIDTPAAVERFLSGWSISAAFFVEGGFGPRLVRALEKCGCPLVLLNARHSRTRMRFPRVFASLLSSFSLITCRSAAIAEGMLSLGLDQERVRVLPDLRLTLPSLSVSEVATQLLSEAIGDRPVWFAASTHPADEEAILSAHIAVLKTYPEALLIVAPRHKSRGGPLEKLFNSSGLSVARRSVGEAIFETTQVYIADTFGELGVFYSMAPISFVGGSFGTEGGHTPYEPAALETAILYGPHVKNFSDAYAALSALGAARQVETATKFAETLVELFQNDGAALMARAGTEFMQEQREGLSTYTELISKILARC